MGRVSEALRSEFPVFNRLSYLNAGSVGPTPRAGTDAAIAELRAQADGTLAGVELFERQVEQAKRLRARAAELLGTEAENVALTGATTDGVNAVVGGMELGPGDEVLTTDEEHPGVLAPLAAARERHGISIRIAPFEEVAAAAGPDTKLIAVSHVSWHTGRVVDVPALAAVAPPLLLDGAQGVGARAIDVGELGCDFYAASGQKWLCGPIGSGYLYVHPDRVEQLSPISPGYGSVEDPKRALDSGLRDGAARFDCGLPTLQHSAWALAAMDVLARAGWEYVHSRGPELAAWLAGELTERGLTVAPRGPSTLVSWETADPEAECKRLADVGFVIRHLPGTPYVRASVGAWATEDELERLATSTS